MDLLALLAIGSLLLLTILPSHAKAANTSGAALCLNNVRKWVSAWTQHAQDNDQTYSAASYLNFNPRPVWVSVVLGYSSNRDYWDPTGAHAKSPLLPYISDYQHRVWRCPEDRSKVRNDQRQWVPRVRTYSMNSAFGDGGWLPAGPFRIYSKVQDVQRPSMTWAFMDEHPDSINDGSLAVKMYPPAPPTIIDFPGSLHSGAASLSYVDGRAEIHPWRTRKMKPAFQNNYMPLNIPGGGAEADLQWLSERTTVPR